MKTLTRQKVSGGLALEKIGEDEAGLFDVHAMMLTALFSLIKKIYHAGAHAEKY